MNMSWSCAGTFRTPIPPNAARALTMIFIGIFLVIGVSFVIVFLVLVFQVIVIRVSRPVFQAAGAGPITFTALLMVHMHIQAGVLHVKRSLGPMVGGILEVV